MMTKVATDSQSVSDDSDDAAYLLLVSILQTVNLSLGRGMRSAAFHTVNGLPFHQHLVK